LKLEEYAAQQAQEQQPAPQAQDAITPDRMALQQAIDKQADLMGMLQTALDENRAPADVLAAVSANLFGADSKQTQAFKKRAAETQSEMLIADIRQRKKFLQWQASRLAAESKAIAERIDELTEAEFAASWQAGTNDTGITEVLTVFKTESAPDLQSLDKLYQRWHSCAAVMGLLYGYMVDLARSNAGRLDLIQMQEYEELQRRVLKAVQGKS